MPFIVSSTIKSRGSAGPTGKHHDLTLALLGADFRENHSYEVLPAGLLARLPRLPYAAHELHGLFSAPEAATNQVKGVERTDSVICSAVHMDLFFMNPVESFRERRQIRGRRLLEVNGDVDVLDPLRFNDVSLIGNGVPSCVRKQVNDNLITLCPKCLQPIGLHNPGGGQSLGHSAEVIARLNVHVSLLFSSYAQPVYTELLFAIL